MIIMKKPKVENVKECTCCGGMVDKFAYHFECRGCGAIGDLVTGIMVKLPSLFKGKKP